MVISHATNLIFTGEFREMSGSEERQDELFLNCYQRFGRELRNVGDLLNEREQQRRPDYEELIKLSGLTSLGFAATGLALVFAFQFIRKKYVKHQ